jgi:hypothetical protein
MLLSALPSGLPRSRLLECVNRMRPFCSGVGYQISGLMELPAIDLANSYNPIVVLPAAACSIIASEDLRKLFSSLQSRRAKVLVRETGSEAAMAEFLSLGADMVSMRQTETIT